MERYIRKIRDAFLRLWDMVRLLPRRLWRIIRHVGYAFLYFIPKEKNTLTPPTPALHAFVQWWVELFFYLMDLFGVAEVYETVMDFVKYKARPLTPAEKIVAKRFFGDTIDYRRVRIDESAYIGPKQYRFAYVSFYIINSWGGMSQSLYMHEMTHVWQYAQLGAVYIPRALKAQWSEAGYNYGGQRNLELFLSQSKRLQDFNLEQQADIVSDYYRIISGEHPQWGTACIEDLPTYSYFVAHLKNDPTIT